MTDTPTPQNSTPEGQAANRQQYAALAPALEAWRASVWQRIAQMQGCKHTYAKDQGCSSARSAVWPPRRRGGRRDRILVVYIYT